VALLALTTGACQDPEKKEAEARAARELLEAEKAQLASKVAETRGQVDEALLAHRRTQAAAAYLATLGGTRLVLDASMEEAKKGFLLEEAARQKDAEAILALAQEVLDGERACVPKDSEASSGEEQSSCSVPAYDDACAGVETALSHEAEWKCEPVARAAEGLPTFAFCKTTYPHQAPAGSVQSPYAVWELPTERAVVRTAFVHEGTFYASDYPAPDVDLYYPPNAGPQAECQSTNAHSECTHQCEVQYGKYTDPCAQSEGDYYEHGYEEHGDYDDSAAPEESAEVAAARIEAEAAAAEVAAAQARAEEAAKELEYQQCLAACEPTPEPVVTAEATPEGTAGGTAATAEAATPPPPPPPTHATEVVRLEATPAPGVLVVTVDTRQHAADEKVLEQYSSILVLKDPGLVALWKGKPLPAADTLGTLMVLVNYDEVLRDGDKLSLAPLKGLEGPALVGLFDNRKQLAAYGFSSKKGEEPVVKLEQSAVCAALRAEPRRFPKTYLDLCPPEAAPAQVAAPAEEGAAPTEAPVAGEVTP
jgi:hypothetical protein